MLIFTSNKAPKIRHRLALMLACTCLSSFVLLPGLAMANTAIEPTATIQNTEDTAPKQDSASGDSNQTPTDGTATDDKTTDDKTNSATDPKTENQGDFNKIVLTLGSKKVTVNGTAKTIEATPFLAGDNTMVPLRFIGETVLSCNVDYVAANKTINLTRFDIKAVVDLNKGTVKVEDANKGSYQMNMTVKPQLKGDYTYMPLRFFSELFGCTVNYEGPTKTITIKAPIVKQDPSDTDPTAPSEPKTGAPYAQVGFNAAIAGGPITYTDSSYDPNGLSITARQWMLDKNGKFTSAATIEELMKGAKADTYNVYYRVKNSNNIWSQWLLTQLTILPNQAPVVSNLKAVKADGSSGTINQGEVVKFTYDIANEEWEKITDSRWTYNYTRNGRTFTAVGQPEAFFSDDVYNVTLTVKDAYGNWSDAVTARVTPSKTASASEAKYKFDNLKPGELYLNLKNLNFNELAKSVAPTTFTKDNVNLLASNNPESVPGASILYQDTMQDTIRLRFHHKNDTGSSMNLYAIAKNEGKTPVTITISNLATAGPSGDVIQVGTSVVENFLTYNKAPYTKTLAPGEIYLFNANSAALPNGTSSAGLIDLKTSAPLQFTIAMMKTSSSYKDYKYLEYAPKNSTHTRGTFPNGTLNLSYNLSGKEAEKIVLCRPDAATDYYLNGVDKITNQTVINNGNRGVLHKLTITADKKVALLFNPRGTMYKGVIQNVDGKITHLSTSGIMQGIVQGCTVTVIEAGQTVNLTYLPPSGSDTDLLLVALPYDQLDKY